MSFPFQRLFNQPSGRVSFNNEGEANLFAFSLIDSGRIVVIKPLPLEACIQISWSTKGQQRRRR